MTTTLTEDMVWQLGDNGFPLNTSTSAGAFIDIDKATGFSSAPFRETKKDHEGVDGGFMDAEFETGRDILLTGTVYANGSNPEDILDRLKADWAPSRALVPLYYTTKASSGTRVLFVKPRGVTYDLDTMLRIGCTAIQFGAYAEIPHIFDNTLRQVTISVGATIFTGFGFPLGFSFGFGGTSSTTDGQNVTNIGNRPAPVTLIVNGPVNGPVIYNDTAGVNMAFNLNLGSTDQLVVDTYYRTVRVNGANRRTFMTNAGWFNLLPGDNFLRFRALSGSTGTLNVQWRSAWR